MMFRRLGRVLEKEKERLKENLKKVGGVNNAEETRKKKEALDQLRASYKALLQVHTCTLHTLYRSRDSMSRVLTHVLRLAHGTCTLIAAHACL